MKTWPQVPVTVIGALNLDLYGMPSGTLVPRDSTPGHVMIRAGGVGHNMAKHLARMGIAVELLCALGNDDAAMLLAQYCQAEGIGLRHAVRLPGTSPSYLCIHDETGDMAAAINDMVLLNMLTPERLLPLMPVIDATPLCIADANLPRETLECLATQAKTPLLLDPVSGFKAERARSVIGRFTAVKPNALEAKQLSGESDPSLAADWFLKKGVARVFISLGTGGVFFAGEGMRGHLPATKMRAPNCTGAGDAMAAGIALGMLRGENTQDCARTGIEMVTQHLLSQGGTLL